MDEYAWVHVRCLKTWILHDTLTQIQCVEAETHEGASHDQSLWNLDGGQIDLNRTRAADAVHYTITAPLKNAVLNLALCSMEATARICQASGCIVNVWIVDQAKASGFRNRTWFQDMQSTLQDYKHCFRVVGGLNEDDVRIGTACSKPQPCAIAYSLREWLSSPLAQQQLPAHVSDAWRLVALYEIGGLYFDADVLPINSKVLYLPRISVPSQKKVGAYRLNGGTLRMDAHACDNSVNAASPSTFLNALVRDHLEWAPRLAKLPQERQTFGFLGPCALTRVYTRLHYTDEVTILPHELVEPTINAETICSTRPLAIHFSGMKKFNWKAYIVLSSRSAKNCVPNLIRSMCPRSIEQIEQTESS